MILGTRIIAEFSFSIRLELEGSLTDLVETYFTDEFKVYGDQGNKKQRPHLNSGPQMPSLSYFQYSISSSYPCAHMTSKGRLGFYPTTNKENLALLP